MSLLVLGDCCLCQVDNVISGQEANRQHRPSRDCCHQRHPQPVLHHPCPSEPLLQVLPPPGLLNHQLLPLHTPLLSTSNSAGSWSLTKPPERLWPGHGSLPSVPSCWESPIFDASPPTHSSPHCHLASISTTDRLLSRSPWLLIADPLVLFPQGSWRCWPLPLFPWLLWGPPAVSPV